ncbi:MAG: hypothetical protein A4E20_10890 [Nitrospira sp. SG-bin2]|uniref:hypothetical protein n=1 Tax=Nitrospira cf. moscoviensis SBR1015 TaxID=96242 RepID=UPI000A0E0D86|nr:hypothetical protein [Nitrospira cf. moscoviensis SBR1015]OQW34518.1 MAG: hypothetical protein A4E20_10890 [Nitrospira sp. SG-bin2]
MITRTAGVETIALKVEPAYQRVRIEDSDEFFIGIRQVKSIALGSGLIHFLGIETRGEEIVVKFTDPKGVETVGDIGDSIVLTFHGDQLRAIAILNGPNGKRNNACYSDSFPGDEDAIEVAELALAEDEKFANEGSKS